MINLWSLSSGSSGNSSLVKTKSTNILIDCGLSGKKIETLIRETDTTIRQIDAILVTHEHIDHINSVGILSRRYDIPVYASLGTWREMEDKVGEIPYKNRFVIKSKIPFVIKDVKIIPFEIPHDANEPLGFRFDDGSTKACIATDIGHITEDLLRALVGCDKVLLESNHDVKMLLSGRYPEHLKKRIYGKHGHLSNKAAAKVCTFLLKNGTKSILLGHLSEENNHPQIAYNESANALIMEGAKIGYDISLNVAMRYGVCEVK